MLFHTGKGGVVLREPCVREGKLNSSGLKRFNAVLKDLTGVKPVWF